MSKQNYEVTTSAIISAISSANPQRIGTVWTPTEVLDVQEAEALVNIGYAKKTSKDATVEVRSVAKPVEDDPTIAAINEFLSNDAKTVVAAVEAATDEQKVLLPQMLEVERANSNRKTVIAALENALKD